MYKVQPMCENVVISDLPTSMYKVQSFYESIGEQSVNSKELEDALKHQDKHLRKLTRLQEKTNELCDELHLDHLIIKDSPVVVAKSASTSSATILEDLNKKQESQLKKLNLIGEKLNKFCEQFELNLNINDKNANTTANPAKPLAIEKSTIKWDEKLFENLTRPETKQDKGSSVPEDLAIHVDPNYVPVLLFSQINRLAATYKCFVKFHVHGTVLINEYKNNAKIYSRVENLKELFTKLKLNMNESRLKYDLGFTFIWKTAQKPENQIEIGTSTSQFCEKIQGEVNVMKHLNTLIKEASHRVDVDTLKKTSNQDALIKLLKQF